MSIKTSSIIRENLGLLIVLFGILGTLFTFGADWKKIPDRVQSLETSRTLDREILIRIDERLKRIEEKIEEKNKK